MSIRFNISDATTNGHPLAAVLITDETTGQKIDRTIHLRQSAEIDGVVDEVESSFGPEAAGDARNLLDEAVKKSAAAADDERQAAAEPPPILPSFVSAAQLCASNPEMRKPVIHGVLREGETGNMVAGPKSYKSYAMMQLAVSVGLGIPWLGRYAVEQGDVLIIDNELHAETLANRLPRVAAAMGVDLSAIGDHIFVESLRGRLRDIHALAPYFAAIEPGRFKLIILDALYRLLPAGVDENSNGDMAAVYNAIDRDAAHTRAAVFLVHHTSKGLQSAKGVTDLGAGAGAQSRACDAHVVLRPHEDPGVMVVDAVVRSFPPINAFCIKWEYPIWHLADDLDPTQLLQPKRSKPKPADADPAEPEIVWTPQSFTQLFVAADPRTEATILSAVDAFRPKLSGRKGKQLMNAAIDAGLIHRWTYADRKQPHRFATTAQPVLATGKAGEK